MRVLVHLSHHQTGRTDGWSGAPGEAIWVQDLVSRIIARAPSWLQITTVDGDLVDHPAYHTDYDAFIAPHYEADVHGFGGWLWGRAAASLTGAKDDVLGKIFERRYSQFIAGGDGTALIELLEQPQWNNPNITDYYGFRWTTDKTPGILAEHGVGWGADKDWLRAHLDGIAQLWIDVLGEFGGQVVETTPTQNASVLGPPAVYGSPPDAHPDAAVWAQLYRTLAPQLGVRPEIAFAQALKETGSFQFTGTAQREWNNPCGLGVGTLPIAGHPNSSNCQFPTKEEGARAHLGHLYAYSAPVGSAHVPGFCDKDPRHVEHKGLALITDYNGKWAVPGVGYGQSVLSIVGRIVLSGGTATVDDTEFMEKYNRLIAPGVKLVFEGTDGGKTWDNGGLKGVLNTHGHDTTGPKRPA